MNQVLKHALWTVPAIVLAGFASGWLANSGYGNPWFDGLAKPWFMPPGWLFPVVWTTLYVLMGLSLALLIQARARVALILFAIQLALNLAWTPLFFGAHQAYPGLLLIVVLDVVVLATIAAAWAARRLAALLLLPYPVWLALATALNFEIVRLNP